MKFFFANFRFKIIKNIRIKKCINKLEEHNLIQVNFLLNLTNLALCKRLRKLFFSREIEIKNRQ